MNRIPGNGLEPCPGSSPDDPCLVNGLKNSALALPGNMRYRRGRSTERTFKE
ncbi:hypothetical protein KIH86_00385 [Paenibacillus sp. HN-1]|uniref:hypothetical protein n=1 Tax=Paenibacillus TaxID=44249 RepID=UPI001CAA30B1|nr:MULTISPECIES: hypothetical protein [Paenibacillus]MBY9078556.1 hypothetical protein [Paenibacillus sp. CGMCC 1.18879]MBY9082704.1 hypothetical protein [Paenibacillus sinensis]